MPCRHLVKDTVFFVPIEPQSPKNISCLRYKDPNILKIYALQQMNYAAAVRALWWLFRRSTCNNKSLCVIAYADQTCLKSRRLT
jgi:hypothetical protein